MMVGRRKNKPVQFNVLVASELRDRLRKEAKKNGVSLNAETAARLGKAFAEETAFGGEAGRGFLYFLATTFVFAGERYYRDHISPEQKVLPPNVSLWINQPEAHEAAMMSAIQALMLHQPSATLDKCRMQIVSLKGRIETHFLNKEKTP